jgi:hypothetical protein
VTDAVKHKETRVYDLSGVRSECTCGAHWTHPITRLAQEIDSIFASHVKYFERTTVTL